MDPEHGVPPQDQENFLLGMINENQYGPNNDPDNDDVTKTFLNESGEGDESLNRGDGFGEVDGEEGDEGEADEGEGDGSGGTLNLAKSGEVYTYVLL